MEEPRLGVIAGNEMNLAVVVDAWHPHNASQRPCSVLAAHLNEIVADEGARWAGTIRAISLFPPPRCIQPIRSARCMISAGVANVVPGKSPSHRVSGGNASLSGTRKITSGPVGSPNVYVRGSAATTRSSRFRHSLRCRVRTAQRQDPATSAISFHGLKSAPHWHRDIEQCAYRDAIGTRLRVFALLEKSSAAPHRHLRPSQSRRLRRKYSRRPTPRCAR